MFAVVNPGDKHFAKNRWCLAFGAYGSNVLLVWANHLEDALDECIDWIADHAPGLLCVNEVAEAYQRAIAEGKDEETAYTESTVDTICAGNCGNYINSWEVQILAENPDRRTLKEIVRDFDK